MGYRSNEPEKSIDCAFFLLVAIFSISANNIAVYFALHYFIHYIKKKEKRTMFIQLMVDSSPAVSIR